MVGDLLPPRRYALTSGIRRTVAGEPELEREDDEVTVVVVVIVVVVVVSAVEANEAAPVELD